MSLRTLSKSFLCLLSIINMYMSGKCKDDTEDIFPHIFPTPNFSSQLLWSMQVDICTPFVYVCGTHMPADMRVHCVCITRLLSDPDVLAFQFYIPRDFLQQRDGFCSLRIFVCEHMSVTTATPTNFHQVSLKKSTFYSYDHGNSIYCWAIYYNSFHLFYTFLLD
jgi:hypothetical protein